MAKKNMLQRETKRLKLFNKYKEKRNKLKQELSEAKKSGIGILEVFKKFDKIPRNSSKIRLRNRCWKTGRPHGFYRYFGLCRNVLREFANNGLIPGLKKSSW